MKWLIQSVLLLALFMFVRGVLRALFASKQNPSEFENPQGFPFKGPKVKQGRMEKDPVCGTYVDVRTSLKQSSRGDNKYFCSPACLEKFKQSR